MKKARTKQSWECRIHYTTFYYTIMGFIQSPKLNGSSNAGPCVTLQVSFFEGQMFPFISYEVTIATRWRFGWLRNSTITRLGNKGEYSEKELSEGGASRVYLTWENPLKGTSFRCMLVDSLFRPSSLSYQANLPLRSFPPYLVALARRGSPFL